MRRRRSHLRTAACWLGLLALSSVAISSCVYFNTYYNAQKSFRQAEKARLEEERRSLVAGPRDRDRGSAARKNRVSGTSARRSQRGESASPSSDKLYEKALEKASAVLADYRESDLVDDAMFLAGRAQYWLEDYNWAAQSFLDLERFFPESEYFHEAMYWRGLCLEAMREYGEAASVYRTLLSAAGATTAAKAGFRLGEVAYGERDFLVAIEEYAATLEAFPDTDLRAELWLRTGESHLELADEARLDSALVAFAQVLEEDPADEIEYRARLSRGQVLNDTGQPEAALDAYLDLLREGKFRSFEGRTRIVLGQHYQLQDRLGDALEQYETVRDDFPKTESSAMALYRTGQLYLQEYSDRTRAEEYFREVAGEKGNSEGNQLAKEMLADMKTLARTQRTIHRADSLAAARASKKAAPAAAVEESAAPAPSATDSVVSDSVVSASVVADSVVAAAADTVTADSVAQADGIAAAGRGLDFDEDWDEFDDAGEEEEDSTIVSDLLIPRPGRTVTSKADTSIERALFNVAEIYRDRLGAPDSAAYYYEEIMRRFPANTELPRAMYNLAWVRLTMQDDMERARPALESLIARYPQSVHANAARGHLGLPASTTDEDLAVDEFERVESRRREDVDAIDIYLPLLDSLVARYPDTNMAAKAAFVAAWSVENIAGDSTEATRRYDDIVVDYPSSHYAALGRQRRRIQKQGLLDKLARQLTAMSRGVASDEGLEVIALEPTRDDSTALARKYLGFALRAHRRERLDKAKELYERSLEQKQNNPRAQYGLGEIAWDNAYYEDAVDYFRTALRQESAMPAVHHQLFAYHLQQSREDSANHYLRQIIKRDRKNFEAQAIADEYPDLMSGRDPLDQVDMEEIDLQLPSERFDPPPGMLKLKEEPVVRHRAEAQPPTGMVDAADVLVDVLVSRAGLPEAAEVFDGPDSLHAQALDTAKQFLFYPAEDNRGKAQKVWVELAIPFRPGAESESTAADSARASSVSPDTSAVSADTSAVPAGVPSASAPNPVDVDSGAIDAVDAIAPEPAAAGSTSVQMAAGDSL